MAFVECPSDFAEVATQKNSVLAERYGVSEVLITRWRKEVGVHFPHHPPVNRPVPIDFIEHAAHENTAQLVRRFKVAKETVTFWRYICRREIEAVEKAVVVPDSTPKYRPTLPSGVASAAATFLQKTYRPVYHRVIEDVELRGTYVVGRQIMTDTELVEHAKSLGYKPFTGGKSLDHL